MDELVNTNAPFKPGTPITIIGAEAQTTVGGKHGVVVGDTAGHANAEMVKVVVALDTPGAMNALVSPADLEIHPST